MQLQGEMERMAQHTRQPEVLRELFAALGNVEGVKSDNDQEGNRGGENERVFESQ